MKENSLENNYFTCVWCNTGDERYEGSETVSTGFEFPWSNSIGSSEFWWGFYIIGESVARLYHELSWSWHMSFHSEDIKWLGMTDIFQKRICWRQELLCQKFSAGLWFICSGWVAQWDHSCIWESGTIFPWGASRSEVAELLCILYISWSIIALENKTKIYGMTFCLFVDLYRHHL